MDKAFTLLTGGTDYGTLSGGLNTDAGGTPLSVNGDSQVNFVVSGTHSGVTVKTWLKTPGGTWVNVAVTDSQSNTNLGSGAITIATNGTRLLSARFPAGMFVDAKLELSALSTGGVTAEIVSGRVSSPAAILVPYASTAQSFAAGISFTGATTINTIAVPDNLADALNVVEGANSYIKVTTTNGSETVTITPVLTAVAGISFTGTTGTNLLKLTDNLASSLDITEGANSYLKFCTTDGSELITAGKTVAFSSGLYVNKSGATAITTTRAVTRADSGGNFTVAQSSAYTITVAQPLGAGERYLFQCVSPGAFDVSLVATGCTFEGTITIDAATIPATGSTLKFASGAAVLGDTIELISTSTTKFTVRAIGSGAGGITVA